MMYSADQISRVSNERSKDIQDVEMGLIPAAATLAIDNRFRTQSLEYKCLGTSFSGAKQKFSIPRDSTWLPCD